MKSILCKLHKMKIIIYILFIAMQFKCMAQGQATDPNFELVWSDEFNVDGPLNNTIWEVANNVGHPTAFKSIYLAENVYNSGGYMNILVEKETFNCSTGLPYTWATCVPCEQLVQQQFLTRSGLINSRFPFSMHYGYAETYMRIPNGYQMHGGWWTLISDGAVGAQNAAEIDIAESDPTQIIGNGINARVDPNLISTNLHWTYPGEDPVWGYESVKPISFDFTQFHKYGLEWTPNFIRVYIDGYLIRTITNHQIVDPVDMLFNVSVDGDDIEETANQFPDFLKADYIRVYKYKGDCAVINTLDNFVHKSVTIGGTGCNSFASAGQTKTIRANDFILINSNFNVPMGASLMMDGGYCE
jgi:beta-glucanase (GH16 family)